jgi:hypothetical protein
MNFALQQITVSDFRVHNRSHRALFLHHPYFFPRPCSSPFELLSSLLFSASHPPHDLGTRSPIAMGQDELELPDLPEGKDKEQGGGAPVQSRVAGAGHGLARGEASSEQEGDSGAGDAGSYAAAGLGNDEEEDAKVIFASVMSAFRDAPFLISFLVRCNRKL